MSVAAFVVANGFDAAGSPSDALDRISQALVATIPFGFLVGLLRSRLAQGEAVSQLIARLGQAPGEGALRAALADALGDRSLALAYWLPESSRYVDALGHPVSVSGAGWTPVEVQGRRIAAIAHDPALDEEPQLVRAAGAAAALALENQRLEAELRARIEELRASRARLVEAGDAERRRLERDLHDGAQSRLVALALKLKLARMKVERIRTRPRCWMSRAQSCSLARRAARAGPRHPPGDPHRPRAGGRAAGAGGPGAGAGVRDGRGGEPVAGGRDRGLLRGRRGAHQRGQVRGASSAAVAVRRRDGSVVVEVADDGVGGADVAGGSGLRGLADRVGALDGRIELESPAGEGTRLRAKIPC